MQELDNSNIITWKKVKTGRIICHAEEIELYSMNHADALKAFKQEST